MGILEGPGKHPAQTGSGSSASTLPLPISALLMVRKQRSGPLSLECPQHVCLLWKFICYSISIHRCSYSVPCVSLKRKPSGNTVRMKGRGVVLIHNHS